MRKKTYYRYIFALLSIACVVSLVAFFSAWTFAPHVAPHTVENKADDGPKAHVAYVVSNGWHAGVVVPAGRINALLPELKKRFEKTNATSGDTARAVNYYEIGWGDRGFYEAKEITTLMTVQAMFNSPGSVMHVVAVHNPLRAFGKSQVIKFCLNEAQLASLEKFIVSSFATNTAGHIISRRPGLYGDSQFFEASGTYHFLNSCNTWAAKALRSAGFDIKPTFKLFANQVMNNIDAPACQVAM